MISDIGDNTLPTFEYGDRYGVDHFAKYFVRRLSDKFCFTLVPLVLPHLRIRLYMGHQ